MKAHKDNLARSGNFPKFWEGSDGTTYTRQWLESVSIPAREALGWYEVVENIPAYNPATERLLTVSPLVFTGSSIEQNYTVEAIPQAEIDARAEQQADQDDAAAIKVDVQVKALILARPAQIEKYIANNVTDLASAKTVITILAKAISALGKREFR